MLSKDQEFSRRAFIGCGLASGAAALFPKVALAETAKFSAEEPSPSGYLMSTRQDWIRSGTRLMGPWIAASEQGVDCYDGDIPTSGARPFARWFEGLVRPLSLAAPLLVAVDGPVQIKISANRTVDLADWYRKQFEAGVDDFSLPCAWSVPTRSMDQVIVETSTLAINLVVSRRQLWDTLSPVTQKGLAHWLDTISHQLTKSINNWNLFPIVTQLALRELGMPYDKSMVEGLLQQVERFYHSDGWYADGYYRQFDYYVADSIYMLLLAAEWTGDGGELKRKIHGRAAEFAVGYEMLFDQRGRYIAYGRSRSYRFAASYFWSMSAYVAVPGINMGLCRSLISENVEWFLNKPIFAADGRIAGGFAYVNERVNEGYISPGSCAWAFQSFLPLALPADHPFWTTPVPPRKSPAQIFLPAPNVVLTHDERGDNATLYNGGIHHPFDFGGHIQKYGKFAYSSHFGFNTSGNRPEDVADNVISLSADGDGFWSHRYRFEVLKGQGNWMLSRHNPFTADSASWITTALLVRGPWHVRVHELMLSRDYYIRDTGTPVRPQLGNIFEEPDTFKGEASIVLRGANGCVAGWSLDGALRPERSFAEINVNVLYRRVFVPFLAGSLPAGHHVLASAWYCSTDRMLKMDGLLPPVFEQTNGGDYRLVWTDGTTEELRLPGVNLGQLNIITGSGFPWPI